MKIFLNHKQHTNGFVLPTVLVLSVVLMTLGLSVFQLTSSIARSLTDQYWQKLSKQTAQAGVSYVSACIDQGLSPSTWPTSITQDNTCLGASLGTQANIFTNSSDTNPIPNPYRSNFTIYRPTTGGDGIPKARVVGSVNILNTAGSTIKTYTYEMLAIVNGPTQAYTQIVAGYKHTCGLTDGKVYCWGSNAVDPPTTNNTITGQLGIGSTSTNVTTPNLVGGLLSGKFVTSVSAGRNFTCAVANGQVYCWGANGSGQLGNNSTTYSAVPVSAYTGQLVNKRVTAIGTGTDFACALANGQVYCWGEGSNGQHGNNPATPSDTSVPDTAVATLTNVLSLSVGGNHACAIMGPAAYCWGNGSSGQLGNGATPATQKTPVQVAGTGAGAAYVNKIYANNNYTCALAIGSSPYCWGANGSGQLGNNSTSNASSPQPLNTSNIVGLITDMTTSSASEYHTCALANGNAFCWGAGSAGQLGNNGTSQSNIPVAVNTSGLLPTNRTITNITTGGIHTCALAEGQPYCWGSGVAGSLGNGVDNASCGCTYSPNSVPRKTINSY